MEFKCSLNSHVHIFAVVSIQVDCMLAVLADLGTIDIEQVRDDSHYSTDGSQNGEGVMCTNCFIDRPSSNSENTSNNVSGKDEEAQSRSRVYTVCIDDIHVGHKENGHDSITK